MQWKHTLTNVGSITAAEARETIAACAELQLIDVRQPNEYHCGHIPGATLLPILYLLDRMDELDKTKPVLVYCAIGGRSRVAAQILYRHGFTKVLNLEGGYKAWKGWTGYGEYDEGLALFQEPESMENALTTAHIMEGTLEVFYRNMAARVTHEESAAVFTTLADIENEHKTAVAALYRKRTGNPVPSIVPRPLIEGLPPEYYMTRLGVDLDSIHEILCFAMAVEAQALDLYLRALKHGSGVVREFLQYLASEEKEHLQHLSELMDSLPQGES